MQLAVVQWSDREGSLIARYSLLISLSPLIPIPLVDGYIEDALKRRLFDHLLKEEGVALSGEQLAVLANAPSGGCLGLIGSCLIWPFKTLLKGIFFVFLLKGMADAFSRSVHQALMLQEAARRGWLVDRVGAVRVAMDRSFDAIDTRPIERAIWGSYRDVKDELNGVVARAVELARAERVEGLAGAIEADALGVQTSRISEAFLSVTLRSGLSPELLHRFVLEMER